MLNKVGLTPNIMATRTQKVSFGQDSNDGEQADETTEERSRRHEESMREAAYQRRWHDLPGYVDKNKKWFEKD